MECYIKQADFAPFPKPADCDLDWADRAAILEETATAGLCHGDVRDARMALEQGTRVPVLDYGRSLGKSYWACLSEEDGLTCWNVATQHGFKLSREALLRW